jgi:PAS domain S-box-containing protein
VHARSPHLRRRYAVSPPHAPVLRYGVALLSIVLALIPCFLLTDVVESRLLVFAVAVMVSAWYGGWKPGLAATTFALTVSGYFALIGVHTPTSNRRAFIDLGLFVLVALLICWANYALRSVQEGLHRSELNFRSLVTNAPYGICRCDAHGILLDVNPALVHMLGYDSADALTGENLANLHRDSQQWFTVADCLRSLQPFKDLTSEWVGKDGKPVLIRLSGSATPGKQSVSGKKDALSFELFAEDITDRRALEEQLRHAQKMEAVGRLAGGIAHDFNNLLMVISGYCEFLTERTANDAELRGLVQEIARAAERAAALTRQLLTFSRKQMVMPKVVDLNAVVAENAKMLTRVIGEDIDLAMIPRADLGLIRADPSQIEQVIMNLAVNARDAMPHGGRLTIETSNVVLDDAYARTHAPVQPGEFVMLAISDTGTGMDSETQARIFEPFFTTKGAKGTGLGLSTVYGIVQQSDGYIWVYSELGKGTTFEIYLPRVSGTAEALGAPSSIVETAAGPFREMILLVEDENTLRSITRQYLTRQGYTVLEANNGVTALQLSATQPGPIHLLLTDVIMPGMNGRELADRLTSVRPETRVLYMSGYTENAIGHNGVLEAGTNLLQKPFTLPALKAKVREVLDTALPQEVFMAARSFATPHIRSREKVSPFRAQRFNLHLPMKYRQVGEHDWREATTENISRSGLLFQADETLSPNVQLEINLVLPVEIAGLSAAEVVCRGEVVRRQDGEKTTTAMAAKILQYRFQHASSHAAHA